MRIHRLINGFMTFVLLILIGWGTARAQEGVSDDMYPIWSPDGSKILFVSTRTGNYDVFTMNPDGSDVTQLTDDPMWDSNAAWSPDGTQIVFASMRSGGGDIYIIDADGSNLHRMTDYEGYEASPQWSPDGSHILFSRRIDRDTLDTSFALMMVDIETGTQSDLGSIIWTATNENYSAYGTWSPDGSEIMLAYYAQYGNDEASCMNDGNLYRVGVEDGTIREVIHLEGGGYLSISQWSDDNILTIYKSIDEQCFTELESGWYEIDLETREMTERHYSDVFGGLKASPDGERVAYLTYTGMSNQIIVTDPSLFSLQVMLESTQLSNPYGLSWSPDGTTLVASLCTDTDADVFAIDVETGAAVNLTADAELGENASFTECGMLG